MKLPIDETPTLLVKPTVPVQILQDYQFDEANAKFHELRKFISATTAEQYMKKNIYVRTRNFRTTATLDEELQSLAKVVNRHESDLIREAVWAFVKHYKTCPHEIVRVA